MSQSDATFGDLIAAKAKARVEEAHRILRVAVLGPGLATEDDPGRKKRKQIRDALEDDGHDAFFPEGSVIADPLLPSLVEQERELLAGTGVDLVIILHTSASVGVIAEIGNFVSVPAIKEKTAILFPIEHYRPDQGLVANTVQDYLVKLPYTKDYFDACQIVSECRKWAEARASGEWPGMASYSL